jgi:hypothetical protein
MIDQTNSPSAEFEIYGSTINGSTNAAYPGRWVKSGVAEADFTDPASSSASSARRVQHKIVG